MAEIPADFYGAIVALASVTVLAKVVTVRIDHRRDDPGSHWLGWTVTHWIVLAFSAVAIGSALWGLSRPKADPGCAVAAASGVGVALLVLLGDVVVQDIVRGRAAGHFRCRLCAERHPLNRSPPRTRRAPH